MSKGHETYNNALDALEAKVLSGKYKPNWLSKKQLKKIPQSSHTNYIPLKEREDYNKRGVELAAIKKQRKQKIKEKYKKQKSQPSSHSRFGVYNKEGNLSHIDNYSLPDRAPRVKKERSSSGGPVQVKGYCVKAHTRHLRNGNTVNVKGYCVKSHSRSR